MTERLRIIQNLLLEASEMAEPQRRTAFLTQACGADRALRQEVEELLQSEADARNFLPGQPAACASRAALQEVAGTLDPEYELISPKTEQPGDRIGRYKLLQKIGEGGCGVVYMAEQEEPVRRGSRSRSSSWAWTPGT